MFEWLMNRENLADDDLYRRRFPSRCWFSPLTFDQEALLTSLMGAEPLAVDLPSPKLFRHAQAAVAQINFDQGDRPPLSTPPLRSIRRMMRRR